MHDRLDFIINDRSKYAEELLLPMFEAFSEWEDFDKVLHFQHGIHRVRHFNDSGIITNSDLEVCYRGAPREDRIVFRYKLTYNFTIESLRRTTLFNLSALNYIDGDLSLNYPTLVKA